MAESVSDAGKGVVQKALHATISGDIGGPFKFSINADRVVVAILAGSAVTLGGIYAYYKYKSRELELKYIEAANRGFDGENHQEEQEIRDIGEGCLHVLLHCFTDKRFLEVLEDFRSGRMKERLEREFLNIGIETEGLVVEIENIKEVKEREAAIRKRKIEKTGNDNTQDNTTFFKSDGSFHDYTKEPNKKTNDDPGKAKAVNLPGDLAKHSSPTVSNTGDDERELQDQSSETLTTATTTIKTTNTHHENTKTPISKYTLKHARTVDNHTLTNEELTTDKIPHYIFKNLMLVNYHVREFEIKSPNSVEDNSQSNEQEEEATEEVNPMDAILAIFHLSDDSLRRYLCNKLSACQLSIPFLLPDFDTRSKNITILLSALQNITKSWNDGSSTKQVFATEHPFPVVSFIRIGKPKISKSSLVNKIMSDGDITHDFFFHKDMKGGHVKRKIVDGLVEVSWHLPGRRKDSTIKKEVCFANLRGDARNLQRQLDLLYTISSVLFILLPSKFRKEKGEAIPEETLEETKRAKGKVILIFKKKIKKDDQGYFKDLKLSSIIKDEEKNENRFLLKIRQSIEMNINKVKATPLVGLASRQREDGVHLDVSQQLDLEAEKIYGSWLNLENRNAKKLLKLQKHIPVLADLVRERYCPKFLSSKSEKSENVQEDVDRIDKNMANEKTAQKKTLKDLDERILNSLNCIAMMDEIERNYTVNSMKHCLDKMSLQITSKLREDYDKAKQELRERTETPQESDTQSPEEKRLEELEESISEYSFGLEHIVRELAQLYQLGESKYDYAGAAAEMLLSGQPLEILDGDSSYIPLKWLKAVYSNLHKKTKSAQTFVISVLGIQGSGKSTLLNTMFGLEFPVSAGRCTRGAFANLIPVGGSLKSSSGFDYVLIVDTEGLQGSADTRIHDNRLATFAIGVADVTIVNIMGENYNEIKEFLELAIHAFLKMNLVEGRKRSCKIVHQNVGATDARDKSLRKRSALKENLDEMTKLAAREEKCEQRYKKIDDIISFDKHNDVFYIPSLLKGSPPMAPVNPEYGRAVQEVKKTIINLMCSKECVKIFFSQFQDRVCKLWEAMLRENFIFSFGNVIEVRAFTSLDRKYFNESVKLMVIKMGELQTKIEVALKRCSTREELTTEWKERELEILQEADKLGEKMKEAMNKFFKTDQDKAILEQWRENIMNRIKEQKEIQVRQVRRNCESTFDFVQNLQGVEKIKQTYKTKLIEKARDFITSTAAVTSDEETLKAKFKEEWQQWIACVPEHTEIKQDINNEMVNVLCNTDPSLNTKMRKKLEKQNHIIPKIDDNVDDSHTLSIFQSPFSYMLGWKEKQWQPDDRRIKYIAKREAHIFANKASKSGARCTRNNLTQMYHEVSSTVDEETKKFIFKSSKSQESLKCDILLHAFAETYEMFNEMEERFIQQRDIRSDLEMNLRPRLETLFENACKQTEKEKLAAISFVEALQIPFQSALNSTLGGVIASKMLDERTYKRKGQFHAKVLIELGEKPKFESYKPYLKDPVGFLSTRLKVLAEDYCLNEAKKQEDNSIPGQKGKSAFEEKIRQIEMEILNAISIANKEDDITEDEIEGDESKKLTFWIQRFVEECKTLVIKDDTFASAKIHKLGDIEVYKKEVSKKVTHFVETLINRGLDRNAIQLLDPSPSDILFEHTIGCQCVCPFCGVLCDAYNPNHESMGENNKHATKLHRPTGISGYFFTPTRKLSTTICTTNVAGKGTFRNADTTEFIPYKDYQSVNAYYKSWSIDPVKHEELKYFKWFMATFSKELAEFYKAGEPDIPKAWKSITFEDAKNELRDKYNL